MAVDLSTQTGWAYGRPGAYPAGGVWLLGGEGTADAERFVALDNELTRALIVFAPDLLIMATPLNKQQTSAYFLIGCCAITEAACARRCVRPVKAAESTARKAVLGRGMFGSTPAAKAAVDAWAQRENYQPIDDNHADALLMWRYACEHVKAKRPWIEAML